ncbi:DUF6456 domain-containing protein [Amaricoccus sp.]|uniref:DUF6456 domain-containing protein n=1 Tax=Amaricoccus sp. TaxID=1872485 RepID=UPI001B5AF26D|nr:DUF6456 domain-containing protein [Amaricoccus sp.]MBP7240540.1 helix-turn-helix domain-containing protein [Amaricoccus sp.]
MPTWLPEVAATYLAHTSAGIPIRALARAKGCHASTILRQVRRVEAWRDDPLVDEALERLGRSHVLPADPSTNEELSPMSPQALRSGLQQEDQAAARIEREARRILRRLCEKGAFLAVAPTMEKAVVLREVVPGKQNRIAVVDRDVAHAFALQEWIACEKAGKIACYGITAVGRAALKRLLTEERMERGPQAAAGFAEGPTPFQSPFQEQHRFFAEREVMAEDGSGERRLRFNLAESPLSVLGRKRDKDGVPYLKADLIEAGERLREDFELAQLGPRVAQNWDRFLTAGGRGQLQAGRGQAEGPQDARVRVAKAMEALGPGLSDVVFRVCCFLEGLETAEKRLGWSARSGKVVLKIALERLAQHYGVARVGADRRAMQ